MFIYIRLYSSVARRQSSELEDWKRGMLRDEQIEWDWMHEEEMFVIVVIQTN